MERRRRRATANNGRTVQSQDDNMVKRSLHTGIKNPVNGNKIVVYNPMGRERSIDATKTIKIQIDKTIFRLSIDEKEKALKIRKMGPGTVRGGMDRITITPQEAYEFLIR